MNRKMTQRFLNDLLLEGKSQSTVKEYSLRISGFYKFLEGHGVYDLTEVTSDMILEYKRHLHEIANGPRTINAKISTLCVFYTWMVINGQINVNPVPNGLHIKPRQVRVERMTDDEFHMLVSWVNQLQENLRAAFWLMIGTGARVGEVAKLRHSDIILKKNRVFVQISDAKWGSDRQIPVVHQEAANIVWNYRNSVDIAETPIFRVSKRTLQTYATDFKNRTGVSFHCHRLRHMFASRLLEGGVPITTIQYLLGHKTVNMTAHYTQSARIDVSSIVPTIFQERGNSNERY